MDPTRSSKIKEDFWNGFLKGQKYHPKTITDTYQIQTDYWIQIDVVKIRTMRVDCHFPIIKVWISTNVDGKDTFHQIFHRTKQFNNSNKNSKTNTYKDTTETYIKQSTQKGTRKTFEISAAIMKYMTVTKEDKDGTIFKYQH